MSFKPSLNSFNLMVERVAIIDQTSRRLSPSRAKCQWPIAFEFLVVEMVLLLLAIIASYAEAKN